MAGALSMAAGEYVSVSSQRDAERADMRLEARELRRDPQGELRELAAIYERRGLPPALAAEVAAALSRRDALEAHARDELGLDEERLARPFQAAWASALSFSAGAALPLLAVAVTPRRRAGAVTVVVTLIALGAARRPRRAARRRAAAAARRSASWSGAPSRWRSPPASARWSAPSPSRARARRRGSRRAGPRAAIERGGRGGAAGRGRVVASLPGAAQLVAAPDDHGEGGQDRELRHTERRGVEDALQRRRGRSRAAAKTSSKAMPPEQQRVGEDADLAQRRAARARRRTPCPTWHAVMPANDIVVAVR